MHSKTDQPGNVTKAGSNIFLDLGLSEAESVEAQAELMERIALGLEMLALKGLMCSELKNWIANSGHKQIDVAKILRVTRPRVSDIVNGKTSKFTIDTLVKMLLLVGKRVSVTVDERKQTRCPTHPGQIIVHDYLMPLGMSITELAEKLGVSRITASKIVNCRARVTAPLALKLSGIFDTTPKFWLDLQGAHDVWVAENA